ncbi:hypothetical protein L228DRAFT_60888 [Xylona heveae TC161]|uniref:Uncharacterized protein n=1 Tax=Xylona heveae (strain CBS 132557 / TC161) TaxID=1328760 RepID=A0A165IL80_XYLHT|nr:hypothetical protein L228DRAFT_60888 [Xylona heveae TC161]KZF25056.1 hypothetical protein L228DRAFT_60888 [Xylona heveae TC161]
MFNSTSSFFISKKWRLPKVMLGFLAGEFPLTVAAMAMFSIASPNLYRTALWLDGAQNGFNSNPNELLYAAANYRHMTAPLPWRDFTTSYNVVISVLTMFILLAKCTLYLVHWFPPILSAVIHAPLAALWAVSIHNQAASDMSDPKHPQPGAPWYLTKSCTVAFYPNNVKYCRQAKGCFALTCLYMAYMLAHTIFGIYSMIPSQQQRLNRQASIDSDLEDEDYQKQHSPNSMSSQTKIFGKSADGMEGQTRFELREVPLAAKNNPMTPRTLAFNTLGGSGDLPLRGHGN